MTEKCECELTTQRFKQLRWLMDSRGLICPQCSRIVEDFSEELLLDWIQTHYHDRYGEVDKYNIPVSCSFIRTLPFELTFETIKKIEFWMKDKFIHDVFSKHLVNYQIWKLKGFIRKLRGNYDQYMDLGDFITVEAFTYGMKHGVGKFIDPEDWVSHFNPSSWMNNSRKDASVETKTMIYNKYVSVFEDYKKENEAEHEAMLKQKEMDMVHQSIARHKYFSKRKARAKSRRTRS